MDSRSSEFTVCLIARNAARTIERALRSTQQEGRLPVVMLDDGSSDDTVEIAQSLDLPLTILEPPSHGNLGLNRYLVMERCITEYGAWIDADDAWEPGHASACLEALHTGLDIVYPECNYCTIRQPDQPEYRPIPPFLRGGAAALCRNFERNYLPLVSQFAFRTAVAQSIQYRTTQVRWEDYDFHLRAQLARPSFGFLSGPTYRMYSYPDSVSKNRPLFREWGRRTCRDIDLLRVKQHFQATGFPRHEALKALLYLCATGERPVEGLGFLRELRSLPNFHELPDNPTSSLPIPAVGTFFEGVFLHDLGDYPAAAHAFESVARSHERPEASYNLALSLIAQQELSEAGRLLRLLNRSHPQYHDPHNALQDPDNALLTRLPLRG